MPNVRRSRGNVQGRNRRARAPQAVTSLSLSETAERQLATRSDKAVFKGKQLLSVISGVNGGNVQLDPTTFSNRLGTLLGLYARWRILKLILKPVAPPSVGGAFTGYGVIDDPTLIPSSISLNEVIEARCSRIVSSTGTDTDELQWNPIDPTVWYSTDVAGDARLYSPCSIVLPGFTSTTTVQFVAYFTIEAEGAYDGTS